MKKTIFLKLLPVVALAAACGRGGLKTEHLNLIQADLEQTCSCNKVELSDQTDSGKSSLLVLISETKNQTADNLAERVLSTVEGHLQDQPDELVVRFENDGRTEDFTFDLGASDRSNPQTADVLSISQLMP